MITVGTLRQADRAQWEELARGYHEFYERTLPDGVYESTWRALMDGRTIFALGARTGDELVGIAHYLFHVRVSFADACYLQDLYVRKERRGAGVGRALIDAVAAQARSRGCTRVYWHTRESNRPARRLYDSVATFDGFIRYELAISP